MDGKKKKEKSLGSYLQAYLNLATNAMKKFWEVINWVFHLLSLPIKCSVF